MSEVTDLPDDVAVTAPPAVALDAETICPRCLSLVNPHPVCSVCGRLDGVERLYVLALPPYSILNNRYFVGDVLGEGGFGITYRGRDLITHEKVAIKEYFPSLLCTRRSEQVTAKAQKDVQYVLHGLKRFREEAQALQTFHHRIIVRINDFFEDNGTGYIVMPLFEGKTLAEYLEGKGNRIDFDVALRISIHIMDALRVLHAGHVMHRDISPENIYLTEDGRVILLDFGSARSALGESRRTVIFRAGFSPIEVHFGSKSGPYTDVYGLAATLYCACSGEPPPPSPEREELDQLIPLSQQGVAIPASAERALMRALAVQPKDRYQSIEEFQRDVTRHMAVEDVADLSGGVENQRPFPDHPQSLTTLQQFAIGAGCFALMLIIFVLMFGG